MLLMDVLWFQMGFGLFIILILISLGFKFRNDDFKVNDEKIIKTVRKKLIENGYENFELDSIISLDNPKITTVIVTARYQEIALEIDDHTGKIINMERISRP